MEAQLQELWIRCQQFLNKERRQLGVDAVHNLKVNAVTLKMLQKNHHQKALLWHFRPDLSKLCTDYLYMYVYKYIINMQQSSLKIVKETSTRLTLQDHTTCNVGTSKTNYHFSKITVPTKLFQTWSALLPDHKENDTSHCTRVRRLSTARL